MTDPQFAPSWEPFGIQILDGDDLVGVVVNVPFSDSVETVADLIGTEVGAARLTATGASVRGDTGWTLFLDDITSTTTAVDSEGVWWATDGATDADRKLIAFGPNPLGPTDPYEPTWDSGLIFLPFASVGQFVTEVQAGTNVTVDNTDPKRPIVSSTGGGGGTDLPDPTGHTGALLQVVADEYHLTDFSDIIDEVGEALPPSGLVQVLPLVDKPLVPISIGAAQVIVAPMTNDRTTASVYADGEGYGETVVMLIQDATGGWVVDWSGANVSWVDSEIQPDPTPDAVTRIRFTATTPPGSWIGQSFVAAGDFATTSDVEAAQNAAQGYASGLVDDLSGVTDAATARSNIGAVATTRTVNGHALSADVVVSASDLTTGTLPIGQVPTGTSGSTVPFGNDARFSDARTPTTHATSHASGGSDPVTLAQSQVTSLTTDLAAKAPLASPTFTGTPAAPTASAGTNSTQIASTAYVDTASGLLIPKSLGTTKGDLIGFSASATPVRLPVGTNGYRLIADSTQTSGLNWQAPATAPETWTHTLFPLAPSATTGDWSVALATGSYFNLRVVGNQVQNDVIGWDVWLSAGTWDSVLTTTTTNLSGIATVAIDGTNVGTIDAYSASSTANVTGTVTGFTVATSGKKRVTLTMATKNGSSGGYKLLMNALTLRRTA